jgi:hypothetical protein
MKNFIILGLTAMLLFAVSAALSMWLNQDRHASESPTTEKSGKKSGEKDKDKDKEGSDSGHKTEPRRDPLPTSTDPASLAAVQAQQRRLLERTDQVNLMLKDLLAQREATDALTRQVIAELKSAEGKQSDLEQRTAELEKKRIDFEAAERKNIERIAGLLDAMSPESAAATLKQMAESGKLEVAAKVLSIMKDRNAARALGELADPALAAQLLDKMRLLKAATPPAPPGGAVPAGGVPPRSPSP